ncbi:hypothetical protein LNP04_08965 [Chryseobacterium sp. C-71]|uniref:hypothetical protein n=1 Tax=Chryseobacterium sp. C-71 TaxID=2893882 RepID=UPI001E5E5C54|nr:hypothetical protein [Chryseobacterium sp. C-71]UFH33812.1 hypothetical protein LNP04_08965 [Chryseobacterium sp. C-71]
MKNKKYSIQICIYLFLFFIWLPFKSQDQLYYNPATSGSSIAEFYKINADSSISYTRYSYGKGKEEISTGKNRNADKENWKKFLSSGKLTSSIKTATPEDFKKEMMLKRFSVKRYGETTPLYFYGNAVLHGLPNADRNMRLVYSTGSYRENANNLINKFELKEIHGVCFFIYQQHIYLLEKENLLKKIFYDGEVVTEDKKNVGNFVMASQLEVVEMGEKYGVHDRLGNVILPVEYQNVMICADAILAKKNNLWYFCDFFGVLLSKKGYRKILPLSVVDLEVVQDQTIQKNGGLLKYVVLDGKNLKTIDDIYAGHPKSNFAYQHGEYSVCGTRSGSYSSQSLNLQLNDNVFTVKEKTYFQNYPYTDLGNSERNFETEKIQRMKVDLDFGKIEFLQKEDEFSTYGYSNNRWVMLLKRTYQGKEFLYPVSFNKEIPDYYSFSKPYFEPHAFDKIEVKKVNTNLLPFQGDYNYYNLNYEDLMINNNFKSDAYFKVTDNGKFAFYSPLSRFMNNLEVKYTSLGDLENRFMRFSDCKGKTGWISEDGEEFYDL